MSKRFFIILVTCQLLLNGVWAQAHKADSDHDSHTVPHLHMDIKSDVVDNLTDTEDKTDEHSYENYFHIHLHAFITSNNLNHFEQRFSDKPLIFIAQLNGLIHTPPVPPPTV